MQTPDLVFKYFPQLSEKQKRQIFALQDLYESWNKKINLISRKDIDQLYLHHVLHSLAIARAADFKPGAEVMDAGTGGGFPGVPLAIVFPETRFHLVDSIGKKINAAQAIADSLHLSNVTTEHARAESLGRKFDFVVSRAVTRMKTFVDWTFRKIRRGEGLANLPNGILYLKGGDLTEELSEVAQPSQVFNISGFFNEPFFEEKKIVYIKR